jgi:ankyrin repeat protein
MKMEESAVAAIRSGDVGTLDRLLRENPDLATARVGSRDCDLRTLLHVATDWPDHFPNGAATVAALIARGADVNARFIGTHTEPLAAGQPAAEAQGKLRQPVPRESAALEISRETPLHWAASCDDVAVLDALLDGGADIEATGAVIGGGTPLADPVAFGQWQAARRLVERGAKTTLSQAAAMGLIQQVEEYFAQGTPSKEEVTAAFWYACHGGQREAAAYLLSRGADVNWVGWGGQTPLDIAKRSGNGDLVEWLRGMGAKAGKE